MPPTTPYERGDVVLVNFMFSEETEARRRPGVVVSSDTYHEGRREAIIVAVTSNTDRLLVGDHLIVGRGEAGLLYPSVTTGIVRTIKQSMITRRIVSLPREDLEAVSDRLRLSLGLVSHRA